MSRQPINNPGIPRFTPVVGLSTGQTINKPGSTLHTGCCPGPGQINIPRSITTKTGHRQIVRAADRRALSLRSSPHCRYSGQRSLFFVGKAAHQGRPCTHGFAAPDSGLAPYPRPVLFAHLGFRGVDGAEKPPFSRSPEKRTHYRVFPRVRVEQLDGYQSAEIAGHQPVAPDPRPVGSACRKMPEDIQPALCKPPEQVFRRRGDRIPEYPAAQPALHAGLPLVDVHMRITRLRFCQDKVVLSFPLEGKTRNGCNWQLRS